jgi:glucokinase
MKTKSEILLAGDIGGTKTNLALFSAESGLRAPLAEATFPSANYPSLEAVAREFLRQVEPKPNRASFGVAGPVIEDQATITNLPWVMSETQLAEELNLTSAHLLNDLVAIANAIPALEGDDLHTLSPGQPVDGGAIAVVAPGTGLGEAYLTWDGGRYNAYASEGGHADFAPTNPMQIELLRYLQARLEHVSYESVCSGKGLPHIYDFLKDSGYAKEPDWLAAELAQAKDRTPVIVNTALDHERSPKICVATLETFVSILGAEAGNMALKVLAAGGVYLGGGIPPRLLSVLEGEDLFIKSFHNKGRLSDVLKPIPVHIILNPKAALLGAAYYGLSLG